MKYTTSSKEFQYLIYNWLILPALYRHFSKSGRIKLVLLTKTFHLSEMMRSYKYFLHVSKSFILFVISLLLITLRNPFSKNKSMIVYIYQSTRALYCHQWRHLDKSSINVIMFCSSHRTSYSSSSMLRFVAKQINDSMYSLDKNRTWVCVLYLLSTLLLEY